MAFMSGVGRPGLHGGVITTRTWVCERRRTGRYNVTVHRANVEEDSSPSVSPPEGGAEVTAGEKKPVNVGNLEANSRLFQAAAKQDMERVEEALAAGASTTATDANGRTPLHFLAAIGVIPLIEKVIAKSADVDAQDMLGLTPLHMAAGYARPATVEFLLEQGANPNLKNSSGATPFALVEGLLANTPEKQFFMRNKKYDSLTEIRLLLTSVTKKDDATDAAYADSVPESAEQTFSASSAQSPQ